MHTITGRLSAAELVVNAGLASVELTIAQNTRYGCQTVRCTMAYGSTPSAHSTAATVVELARPGETYIVRGEALAALNSQVWLMGVDCWTRKSPRDVNDTSALVRARLLQLAGEAHA